jgi:Zn-finger nucleic acid-binding protein
MLCACPECGIELRAKQNAVGVEVMSDFGPYQYFHADLMHCPECGKVVLAGFGNGPIVEHYQKPDYSNMLTKERRATTVYQVWLNQQQKKRYYERVRAIEGLAK